MLRDAKKRGVPISGEACPHHFTLTDAAVAGSDKFWTTDGRADLPDSEPASGAPDLPAWPSYDTNFKMNPPLRSAADRDAILEGLADGTIEILCSDHAPHCDYEKEVEFDYAPFGIIGLETELALSLMQLYHPQRVSLSDLIAKYTVNPARLLHLAKGTLSVGADADITVLIPTVNGCFVRKESPASQKTVHFWVGPSKVAPPRPSSPAKWSGAKNPNGLWRSADFQSAVSRVSNPQGSPIPNDFGSADGLPTGSRQYSRLETCATKQPSLAGVVQSSCFSGNRPCNRSFALGRAATA